MRERFEQRLFRIFAQAGYSPVQLLTVTPEEMVEIPGITCLLYTSPKPIYNIHFKLF